MNNNIFVHETNLTIHQNVAMQFLALRLKRLVYTVFEISKTFPLCRNISKGTYFKAA